MNYVPTIRDAGKYMACRAENPELPDATLEDGWKLEIYCKYFFFYNFCLDLYLESGSKSKRIQFFNRRKRMSRQRELNLIFSKCAYFFFFEKHYFSSRYTSISIEFGKLSERIQHQRRWWCVFWMQCPSQSKTIQNFLEIQCKYKTIFFKKKHFLIFDKHWQTLCWPYG